MNVFVVGATGVLGRPVVKRLLEAGHRVRGLARSPANAERLRGMGAEAASADLFDASSLVRAVAGCEAILHLGTKIPPTARMRHLAAWAENDRVRAEGARNLAKAALETGAGVLVYESFALVYPDGGEEWVDASTPAAPAAHLRSTLAAEAEVARFSGGGGRGVSLRLAPFYGPTAPNTREAITAARRGPALVLGGPAAYQPSVWVDDAASAVVAALEEAPAGLYDVGDDEPLRKRELVEATARAVGRRGLWRLPAPVARFAVGPHLDDVFSRSTRLSNRRFKEATGWGPEVRSAREGWARLATG